MNNAKSDQQKSNGVNLTRDSFSDSVVQFVSGEWILNRRVNGGMVIILRSLWVTTLLYFPSILTRSLCYAEWPLEFDGRQFLYDVGDTLPWVGAIFAAIYAALYARFVSQWNYLANLYNQMMATQAMIEAEQKDPNANKKIQLWKAGFIEDAENLHLVTKPMFAVAVWFMLKDPNVLALYKASVNDGERRANELKRTLKNFVDGKIVVSEIPGRDQFDASAAESNGSGTTIASPEGPV